MKKIGLIGGMTWESSKVYYQILNEKVKDSLGGYSSAKCIMESVDFSEIERLQVEGDWKAMDKIMADTALNLQNAGAEIIILCTNTMHLCSEAIRNNINVDFLHIADATADKIIEKGVAKVLLLGTKYTMEKDFLKTILNKRGIEVVVPNKEDREEVHRVIYEELTFGNIKDSSRKNYQKIINKSIEKGAGGVILGCTEIPLLIKDKDVDIHVFDTTRIHAERAVELSISDK